MVFKWKQTINGKIKILFPVCIYPVPLNVILIVEPNHYIHVGGVIY